MHLTASAKPSQEPSRVASRRARRNNRSEYNIVRAAVYLLRSLGQKPSASKVQVVLKAADGAGMRKTTVCALMKLVFADDGNRSGTEPEPAAHDPEPKLSATGTAVETFGTDPEHHARVKTGDVLNTTLERVVTTPPHAIDESETPEALAEVFLTVYLNRPAPKTKLRMRAGAIGWLREMHSAGHTWREVFTAVDRVYADGERTPLYGTAPIWAALRASRRAKPRWVPHDKRDIGGTDAVAAIKARARKIG